MGRHRSRYAIKASDYYKPTSLFYMQMGGVGGLLATIFLVVGVIMILTLSGVFDGTDWMSVQATVIGNTQSKRGNDDETYPVVKYYIKDVPYTTAVNFSSPDMKVGKELTIKVSTKDPAKLHPFNAPKSLAYAFTGIGAIMSILFLSMFFKGLSNALLLKRLKKYGYKIQGTITEVIYNTSVQINTKNPVCVGVEYNNPIDGGIIQTSSHWMVIIHPMDFDNYDYTADVYVMERDINKCFVDFSTLCKIEKRF